MKYETLVPSVTWLTSAALVAAAVGAVVLIMTRRWGTATITNATLIPIVGTLIFLLGFYGKELDLNYSARPLANEIADQAPGVSIIASQSIKRDMDYGLAFYRNQPVVHYDTEGVPSGEHLLVLRANDTSALDQWLDGRIYKPVFLYESQGLEVYRVYARNLSTNSVLSATSVK